MKKIFKNSPSIIAVLALMLVLSSCTNNEVEPLFEQTIKERTDAFKKKYLDVLTAPENGWIGYYSPNKDFGDFIMLMNFNKDGSVGIKSDYGVGNLDNTITYRLDKTLKIELVLESHSVFSNIFEINNNDNGGEFVFNVLEATEDKVILESKLDSGDDITIFTLKRASNSDLDLTPVYTSATNIAGDGTNSVFRNVLLNNKVIASFDFNPFTREVIVRYIKDGNIVTLSEFILINSTGFSFRKPLTIGEVTLTSFTFDNTTNEYVNTEGDIKIKYDNVPMPLSPYNFGKEAGNIRILRTNGNFVPIDESSKAFVNFFEGWRANFLAAIGSPVSRFYVRDIDEEIAYIDIWVPVEGGDARARFDCSVEITPDSLGNNIVKFTFISDSENNQDFELAEYFEPMTNFIFRESGFYVLKMTPLPFQNTIGLVPVDDTTILVHWYDF